MYTLSYWFENITDDVSFLPRTLKIFGGRKFSNIYSTKLYFQFPSSLHPFFTRIQIDKSLFYCLLAIDNIIIEVFKRSLLQKYAFTSPVETSFSFLDSSLSSYPTLRTTFPFYFPSLISSSYVKFSAIVLF